MVPMALEVAERAADQGIELCVVDPRYVTPVADELIEMARRARLVITLEDNGRQGGAGSTLASALRAAEVDTPLRDIGLPREFLAARQAATGDERRRAVGAGRGAPRHRSCRPARADPRRAGRRSLIGGSGLFVLVAQQP